MNGGKVAYDMIKFKWQLGSVFTVQKAFWLSFLLMLVISYWSPAMAISSGMSLRVVWPLQASLLLNIDSNLPKRIYVKLPTSLSRGLLVC